VRVWRIFIERGTSDTGLLGDLGHRHRQEPTLGDQRRGGVQDRVPHLSAVRLDRFVPQLRHATEYTIRHESDESILQRHNVLYTGDPVFKNCGTRLWLEGTREWITRRASRLPNRTQDPAG
jgi:hypothetical protein